jgi:hypothetical protein
MGRRSIRTEFPPVKTRAARCRPAPAASVPSQSQSKRCAYAAEYLVARARPVFLTAPAATSFFSSRATSCFAPFVVRWICSDVSP